MAKQDKEFYQDQYCVYGKDIFTPVGRASFVYLAEPQAPFQAGQDPKYSISLLIPKDDETAKAQLREIQTMCQKLAAQKFGSKIPPFAQPIFRDGDDKEYQGYPGNWVIVARNKNKSGHSQGFKILGDVLPESIEAGMLVRLQVQPMVGQNGFSYKLRGIKLVKDDGVRFSAAPDGASLLEGLDDAVAAVSVAPEPVKTGDLNLL
jgi:hypothetical protein